MVKTLSPIGNSLGIILDKAILDLLNIGRDTPLEIRTDGESLILRPVRTASGAVSESAQRIMDAHADTLARLGR